MRYPQDVSPEEFSGELALEEMTQQEVSQDILRRKKKALGWGIALGSASAAHGLWNMIAPPTENQELGHTFLFSALVLAGGYILAQYVEAYRFKRNPVQYVRETYNKVLKREKKC